MFGNKGGADARADIIGEQVGCSLGELQEEVEGIEEAFQDMTSIMGQDEEQRGRSHEDTKLLPKRLRLEYRYKSEG